MKELGQKLLEEYNQLANVIVGWEAEQLNQIISVFLQKALLNLDILLPFFGLVGLFVIKPTRPFAIGSLIVGSLLVLGGI